MTNFRDIKFMRKGLKASDGTYYPCWYSLTKLLDGRTALTIYAKSILKGLPAEINPENGSDIMTDYFEKDKVRFYEGEPEFNALKEFAQ